MTTILSVSAATHIGGKPRNEDTFFHRHQPDDSLYMGVFDGHGDYGLEVAETVRDFFILSEPSRLGPDIFKTAEDVARATIKTQALAAGKKMYEAADGSLMHRDGWFDKILRGGTTASLVHVTGDKVRVNHVGDSEVMIIHESGEFAVLMKDHGVTCLDEHERIRTEALQVPSIEFAFMTTHRPVFVRDGTPTGWMINPLGGARTCNVRKEWSAYLHGKMPDGWTEGEGLNMTRSIGDFSLKKHGVVSRPDTVEHTLRPGRNIVLVASDGLFDNYTYEGLRDMVLGAAKKGGAATASTVLEEGLMTGFKNFGKGQDNMTVVMAVVDVADAAASDPSAVPEDSASESSEPQE